MKKTFKIGEYVVGGIIEVVDNKTTITINFNDYNTGKVVISETFAKDKRVMENIDTYIFENGTSYYSDKVCKWIKDNIKLPENTIGW